MIVGLGVDITPIETIRRNLHRPAYLSKIYSEREIAECVTTPRPELRLAAHFAIKEACMKALGSGIRQGVWFTQIEATQDADGAITLQLAGKAAEIYASLGSPVIHVTCTMRGDFALAAVIFEGKI